MATIYDFTVKAQDGSDSVTFLQFVSPEKASSPISVTFLPETSDGTVISVSSPS